MTSINCGVVFNTFIGNVELKSERVVCFELHISSLVSHKAECDVSQEEYENDTSLPVDKDMHSRS